MASIKRLKKDIDYLTFSVVADCFNFNIITGNSNPNVTEIVQGVISSRNDLRDRINNAPVFESKKERKAYFNTLFRELLVSVDGAFGKLSDTVKNS